MPRVSEKRRVINEITDVIEELAVRMATGDNTSEDSDEDANLMRDLIEFVDILEGKRYMMPRTQMRHNDNDNLRALIHDSDETAFRACFRMNRVAFLQIVEMLTTRWDADVAASSATRGRRRRDLSMQLAVALCILGAEGGGSEGHRATLGIGRGTIHLYVERVVEFLSSLGPRYIRWPNAEERRANASASEFERCVGVLDGCIIVLRDSPKIEPRSYFSHNIYGFNLQAVCDAQGRFIYAYMGPTAAVDDSTAFKQSHLYRQRGEYFQAEEYVLADNAYALERNVITPYKEPVARTQPYSTFNSKHDASRVVIENAFGLLKARFPSLDSLPIRIGDDQAKGHQRVFKWTLSCLVLHNLLHGLKDDTDWLADSIRSRESNAEEVPPPTQAAEDREGLMQRTQILETMQRQASHPGSAARASGVGRATRSQAYN